MGGLTSATIERIVLIGSDQRHERGIRRSIVSFASPSCRKNRVGGLSFGAVHSFLTHGAWLAPEAIKRTATAIPSRSFRSDLFDVPLRDPGLTTQGVGSLAMS